MKLIDLQEGRFDDWDDGVEELSRSQLRKLKSCSQFLHESKGLPLLRGMKFAGQIFKEKTPRKDRVSRATDSPIVTFAYLAFNLGIEKAFNIKNPRSSGLFCISDFEDASNFGDPHFVFPENGYKFIWSPHQKIDGDYYDNIAHEFLRLCDDRLSTEEKDILAKLMIVVEKDHTFFFSIEDLHHFLNVVKSGSSELANKVVDISRHLMVNILKYSDKNLDEALRQNSEIIIYDCPKYYAVDAEELAQHYAQDFAHHEGSAQEKINDLYSRLLSFLE